MAQERQRRTTIDVRVQGVARLGPRIVVLSTHLDDGVLSLGAGLAAAVAGGATVTAMTVLAGDPNSTKDAGEWDLACGFGTEAEATAARRLEDENAWSMLGVRPVWLDHSDMQYADERDGAAVWDEVLQAVDAAGGADDLLVPGAPLRHPDHHWLANLAVTRGHPTAQVRGYLEQPYALWSRDPSQGFSTICPGAAWEALPSRRRHRRAARRAAAAYRSQLSLLASNARLPLIGASTHRLLLEVARDERRRGGELVSQPLPALATR